MTAPMHEPGDGVSRWKSTSPAWTLEFWTAWSVRWRIRARLLRATAALNGASAPYAVIGGNAWLISRLEAINQRFARGLGKKLRQVGVGPDNDGSTVTVADRRAQCVQGEPRGERRRHRCRRPNTRQSTSRAEATQPVDRHSS